MPLLLLIYRVVTALIGPIVYRIFQFNRLSNGKESPLRYMERRGITDHQRPSGKVVWFNAASNGESLAALAMIEILRAHYPQVYFLITSGTLTSAKILEGRMGENVFHQFVPYDVPQWINRFLDHWKPDIFIGIESELWPNLILMTAERQIPLVLLNACMSEQSMKNWQKSPESIKTILENFNLILAQSLTQANRLKALGAQNLEALGNIKFASPPLKYSDCDLQQFESQIGKRPVWLAASTHEGEEQFILEAHKRMQHDFPQLLTIIVPRHPQRAASLITLFQNQNISFRQRSAEELIHDDTQIYLADTSGELGLFYRLSEIVFMGGSLTPIGGHNLIEPALLDCVIVHGPHMFNQKEMVQLFTNAQAVFEVNTAAELAKTIKELMSDSDLRQQLKDRARSVAGSQHQILEKALDCLKLYIQNALK